MRTVLLVATIVGFLVTAGGLVQAYRGAVRQVGVSEERLSESKRLMAEWSAATRALHEGSTAEQISDYAERQAALEALSAQGAEVNARFAALFEARDLLPPSYGNAPFQAAFEARHALRQALEGARVDLLWAGAGLIVSTVASAWSLFV